MCRVPGLSVTIGLLAGFAITGIPHTLNNTVGIFLAGVRLAAGGEVEPGAAMPTKHIPGQERVPFDVPGDGAGFFGGIGPVGANTLGRFKELGRDNLQVEQHLGSAVTTAENACIGQVANDTPDGGVVPLLTRPCPVAKVI